MNKQHQEVQIWLEKVFGDKSVPAYELNQYTLPVLYAVMKRNTEREKQTQLLVEEYRQKAEEYGVESRRLEGVLQKVNLSIGSLSQSGVRSVRTLANLALTLRCKNASDTSLSLAMQALDEEISRLEEARMAEQKVLNMLVKKTTAAIMQHGALQRSVEQLENKISEEKPDRDKRLRETLFLRNKTKEYRTQTQKIETHLEKMRVEPSVYHSTLVERAEALEQLKQEIGPMKKKVASFHDLPPNAVQAHMKLEELKEQVRALEEELTKKIDVSLM